MRVPDHLEIREVPTSVLRAVVTDAARHDQASKGMQELDIDEMWCMELSRAGAKIAFMPRSETNPDHKNWLAHVGEVVNAGLDRATALRALTLEPASVLGVDKRLGSLEKDKDANMLFFSGDPLEPGSKLEAVMLEGRIVFGEVKP